MQTNFVDEWPSACPQENTDGQRERWACLQEGEGIAGHELKQSKTGGPMNSDIWMEREPGVAELWICENCGEKNPDEIRLCLACGARDKSADRRSARDSEDRRERLHRLRSDESGDAYWQYLTLVYRVEREGSIGSTFPGHWLHESANPDLQDDIDAELNSWGERGWELVSLMPNSKPSLTREAGETTEWLFLLKRQRTRGGDARA